MDQSITFGKVKLVYDEPVFKIVYDGISKIIVNTLTGKITFGSDEGSGNIDLKCGDIDSETIKINDEDGFLFKNTRITDDGVDTKLGIQDGETFMEAMSISQENGNISLAAELEVGNDTQIAGNLTLINGDVNNSGVSGGSVNTNSLTTSGAVTAGSVTSSGTVTAGSVSTGGAVSAASVTTNSLTVINGDINNSGENGGLVYTNGLTTNGTLSAEALETNNIRVNNSSSPICGEASLDPSNTVYTDKVTNQSVILLTAKDPYSGALFTGNINNGVSFDIYTTTDPGGTIRVDWLLINPR